MATDTPLPPPADGGPPPDTGGPIIQFQQLQTAIDPGFWSKLGDLKLDEWCLSEDPVPVTGFLGASTHAGVPAPLTLDARSLSAPARPPSGLAPVPGTLWLVNSLARFKGFDRAAAAAAAARETAAAIASGAAATDPAQALARFVLVAHADLKTYRFTHWAAVPALVPPAPWRAVPLAGGPAASAPLAAVLGPARAAAVAAGCDAWRGVGGSGGSGGGGGGATSSHHPPAWLVVVPRAEEEGEGGGGAAPPPARTAPLTSWADLTSAATVDVWLAFDDPSGDAAAPGWPARNLLALAAGAGLFERGGGGGGGGGGSGGGSVGRNDAPAQALTLLAVRPAAAGRTCATASRVLTVAGQGGVVGAADAEHIAHVAGWEPNAKGRPGPRLASLAAALDPARLAADALALNLRLMRWRAAPDLDLAAIAASRFLLLGAGTLGCGAARALLGWGAVHVTLVDSGRVSFSNPPRQPLFEHGDCLGGGAPKAAAAAAALRRIFPGSEAVGVDLAIPMPGHVAADPADPARAEAARAEAAAGVEALARLVDAADVVMLLTDTRESRWLPTLLVAASAAAGGGGGGGRGARRPKLAVTAALGFDTFVVMRHGVHARGAAAPSPPCREGGEGGGGPAPTPAPPPPPPRLGCYFCSDVVAPGDSTADRALDQQCTVARPGLAPIASALAVELAAAVLAHPEGAAAPPAGSDPLSPAALPLGPAPHMLRGRLGGGFTQVAMTGVASSVCTACSPGVLAAYGERGVDFVLDALADPGGALEGVSGLAALHAATDARVGGGGGGGGGDDSASEGGGGGGSAGEAAAGSDDEWLEL